ncbi:hypothetical protein PUNSTDRAFT_128059 [Punctularia strigosozonata HHB-11173 SS5]|uniref:Jacalin-type lectin domain-containing protein n=1 Tax=Punctularia strigosozonata (strain HHB-11173) TaxID=741275 RepID=R7S5Z0_PUNST|nr:uncharacterized protein PUNSTDRAFT_128059 [Punctularia strigosozonata HHB-11173 SS5]EIN05301.1 hypothetical protein PUNSTDRAFT_128059 [Punctularia strigosozonata HHB-11173 SS5]
MCGAVVDGFALDFTDGTSTPWNGGKGGKSTEFDLSAGETITMVLVAQDGKDIQRLCFITSSGRQSENYGYSGGAPVVWQFQGAPLVGFAGAYGKASFENNLIVQGLQPIWGGGQAKSASDRLQSLAQRVEALGKEIATGRLECAGLQKRTSALQDSLDAMSKCIGARAMAGIAALVGNIQKLYTADSTTTPALISACKDQGNDVAAVFDVLHMQSVSLMKTGEDLATEAVKQASDAQTRLTQVGDISAIASTIQAGESQEQKTRQTYAQNAQQAIKLAEDSLHAAQDKASKDKKLRIVRDVFSFGAGELGDWGGLNGAISFANAMVQSTQANLSASTAGLASVEQSVQAVQAQLDQTRQLQAELDGFVPALRQLVSQTAALQEKDDQLMSSASDLSIFLGTLWATSETLPVDFTAQRFASQVLALGSVIGTDADLGKALTGDLQQLQTTLDLIAKSPITPLATTGMI